MVRTRAVPRRRPNINLDDRRFAIANKEMKRRIRVSDVKIKFLLPHFRSKKKRKRSQKNESSKSCKTRC